ncbi:hypothetical protein D1N63_19780 [Clostridioides difficile]|nr:hypothetical protein D1N63_19780 [Clostridioides difficile]
MSNKRLNEQGLARSDPGTVDSAPPQGLILFYLSIIYTAFKCSPQPPNFHSMSANINLHTQTNLWRTGEDGVEVSQADRLILRKPE